MHRNRAALRDSNGCDNCDLHWIEQSMWATHLWYWAEWWNIYAWNDV